MKSCYFLLIIYEKKHHRKSRHTEFSKRADALCNVHSFYKDLTMKLSRTSPFLWFKKMPHISFNMDIPCWGTFIILNFSRQFIWTVLFLSEIIYCPAVTHSIRWLVDWKNRVQLTLTRLLKSIHWTPHLSTISDALKHEFNPSEF